MQLIVISAPHPVKDEIQLLHRLFELGLETFHLRKPLFSVAETAAYLKQVSTGYHDRIVLHSHYQLAQEYPLKGIHYTKRAEMFGEEIEKFHSASVHSLEEVKRAPLSLRYVFLSPVFNSISKPGYKSSFSFAELEKHLKHRRQTVKVMALGGIDEHNIEKVAELGFDGAVLLGSLWEEAKHKSTPEVTEKFKNIQQQCQSVLMY